MTHDAKTHPQHPPKVTASSELLEVLLSGKTYLQNSNSAGKISKMVVFHRGASCARRVGARADAQVSE